MNKYYVYVFHDSLGVPYYVGKGSGNRIYQHLNFARNRKKRYPLVDKLHSLLLKGEEILYSKVVENVSEVQAHETERFLIGFYKRRSDGGCLLNLTMGGEGKSGIKPWNTGKKLPEETKRKVSLGLRKYFETNKSPMYGKEGLSKWDNPKSNLVAWSNADIFYRYWIALKLADRPMSRIFPQVSRTVFRSILYYFEDGWVPEEDPDWLTSFQGKRSTIEEFPIYAMDKIKSVNSYLRCEEIYKLFLSGLGSKAIGKSLGVPYSSVSGIINKFKKGWNPNLDKSFMFAKSRMTTVEDLE